ncbi:G-type lectin S-receptor-like serine/threonine-protein kinase LECRK1 [Silene latifolia]|uniref:G-type lectin S-receptor-like serine/threonine-protein kinase LECRK1 n=1 Tax=Silene latifolia TaxID=37657 RepID=UPI003D77A3D0
MAWPLSSLMVFYLALILLQSSPTYSKNSGKFSVGQSLLAKNNGTSLLSPAGDFAFGFHQAPNNTDLYLLSVWYATIPDTIVWCANGGKPVPQGSTLNLTANEGLVLSDPRGTVLWNTTTGGGAVSYGFMNDTGNFALINNANTDTLWQTFDYPTDTLLPTQTLGTGNNVISRISENNLTEGRFQLHFEDDGDLVLNTRDVATGYNYHSYLTFGSTGTNGVELVYSESGVMFIQNQNGSRLGLIQSGGSMSAKYQRVTLGFDGVLIWYYYPNKGAGWTQFESRPDNICLQFPADDEKDSGACGYNSICSLGNDKRPVCECNPNYSRIDPTNSYGSCEPDFSSDFCRKFEDGGGVKGGYTLIQLQNTDWPLADYAQMSPIIGDECKASCMNDCLCGAAIFDDSTSTCWKKKLPLSFGKQDSTVSRTAWLKVSHDNGTNNPFIPPRKVEYKWNAVTKGLLGGFVCVNFILLCVVGLGLFFVYKKNTIRGYDDHKRHSTSEYNTAHSFTYKELESATNGFRDEIGSGAFGVVYKGNITTGGNQYFVAVKRLDRTFKGADKEFTAEVNAIGLTHHKNLVPFIGYCKEEDERLLVYEYMSNGTVADYLFGHIRPSWLGRVQIGQGIARGLLYLHEECTTQIIHCDIKPQNVLVDDYHNARISDFGLAKLLVLNQNHTTTAVRGTKGYVAPEWFKNKPVSVKVDVYSFGVLLLEIICCRKCVLMDVSTDECAILTDWAFDCYQSGTIDCLVKDDMEALNDRPQLERLVKVALWCIQENPDLRPTMKRVTQMLEGVADVPGPPCTTSFSLEFVLLVQLEVFTVEMLPGKTVPFDAAMLFDCCSDNPHGV